MSAETRRLEFVTKDELLSRLTLPYPPAIFDRTRCAAFFFAEDS